MDAQLENLRAFMMGRFTLFIRVTRALWRPPWIQHDLRRPPLEPALLGHGPARVDILAADAEQANDASSPELSEVDDVFSPGPRTPTPDSSVSEAGSSGGTVTVNEPPTVDEAPEANVAEEEVSGTGDLEPVEAPVNSTPAPASKGARGRPVSRSPDRFIREGDEPRSPQVPRGRSRPVTLPARQKVSDRSPEKDLLKRNGKSRSSDREAKGRKVRRLKPHCKKRISEDMDLGLGIHHLDVCYRSFKPSKAYMQKRAHARGPSALRRRRSVRGSEPGAGSREDDGYDANGNSPVPRCYAVALRDLIPTRA